MEAVKVIHIAGTTADERAADQRAHHAHATHNHTKPHVTQAATVFPPRERRGFGI